MKCFAAIVLGLMLSTLAAAGSPPVIGGLGRMPDEKLKGAVLVSELGCAACHRTGQAAFAPKAGPDLSEVGHRVQGLHLQHYIANPSGVKPGTTMPDVLGHLTAAERGEVARALAHYLATLGKPAPGVLPVHDAVERGRKLYHSVGCVACHSPEKPLNGSVPLGPLADKYTLASLAAFLKDPLVIRPGGRMPDCHLETDEATDLASYLLREQTALAADFQPDATLAARGRVLFAEHRCHACHRTGDTATAPELPALAKLQPDAGCLSTKAGKWPLYPLSEVQRASMRSALVAEHNEWTPSEQVRVTITRLNCIACHNRDGLGGVTSERNVYFTGREESLGEQGRIPPPLTGVGAKLKEPWLRQAVCHGASARHSPHTRMPKFGEANTGSLVTWMKQLDTLAPAGVDRVPNSAKPQNIGRDLVGVKGLNCIACHSFRGRSVAIRGPELTTLAERLEENWFHHFLAHPQRFSPLTVMPSYWPDGKSPLPDVLGGDPRRQRDAIWQYLAQGPEAREPEGLVLEPLVIEVRDEAVIVRRAFPGIGKRGLGVGYPGGINLAFDSSQMRLASVWSGGFIEASGIWRGQGAGQARLLGKDPVQFPPGPAFAVLPTPTTAWPEADATPRPSPFSFKGYSLDAQQRPTLRYALEGFSVEDFFHERRDDAGRLFLERTLKFSISPPSDLYLRVARDKMFEPRAGNLFAVGTRLLVRFPAEPLVRASGDAKELLLPIRGQELKLEYHLTDKP